MRAVKTERLHIIWRYRANFQVFEGRLKVRKGVWRTLMSV